MSINICARTFLRRGVFAPSYVRSYASSASENGKKKTTKFKWSCSLIFCFFKAAPAESESVSGIYSTVDHATGEEKVELLAELEGKELYEQYLSGPFGTIENPVIVPSVFNTRIVGCVGKKDFILIFKLWNINELIFVK